jgi:hypothetical protein
MKYVRLFTVFLLVIVGIVPVAAGQNAQPDHHYWTAAQVQHWEGAATVHSEDVRPLWMALNAIQREYGWVIDYEDPIYSLETESTVSHNAQWESLHAGKPSRLPAGTSFSSKYPEDSRKSISASQRQSVIEKIVADFNASPNPGHFEVHQAGPNRVHVIGYSRSAKGVRRSVLDTPVTLSPGTMSGMEALNKLVQALSEASGTQVVLGAIAWNPVARARVELKGVSVPARAILTDIADSANVELMWDFLYDINSNSYFLSLRPRSVVATDESGQPLLKNMFRSPVQ